jgi:predicted metal-binding protein
VAGKAGLADTLASALAGLPFEVRGAECMSACTRPSSVAFRAPGKTAYLFGDLAEADVPDLVTFARLYAASADGTFVDARPLGALRLKAVARIPG